MKYIRRIRDIICLILVYISFILKKIFFKQLFIFISTPCYGNVGDHTIELAQQELLFEAGLKRRTFDFTSFEYNRLSKIIKIRSTDVLLIDGGGNFGDTWPGTIENIYKIISRYSNNKILVFPESWFYSDTENGNKVLNNTIEAISKNKNVIIYARDTWSFLEMKKHLAGCDVRFAYDCVLYKHYCFTSNADIQKKVVGISLRDDKETSGNHESIAESLKSLNYDIKIISNDCYGNINKNKRKKYFERVIKQYSRCDFIITDRFHGFIFSLLCNKPCYLFDNLTGKVRHSYEDLRPYIKNCYYNKGDVDNAFDIVSAIEASYGNGSRTESLDCQIKQYKGSIIKTLNGWRL